MGATCGSGILSSAADVLVIRVLRGLTAVNGVCEMCMCLALGDMGGEGGEWIRVLGLSFTIPVGTGRVVDVCLCLGCGGVGGVGGDWVGAWTRVWSNGVVLCLCEL